MESRGEPLPGTSSVDVHCRSQHQVGERCRTPSSRSCGSPQTRLRPSTPRWRGCSTRGPSSRTQRATITMAGAATGPTISGRSPTTPNPETGTTSGSRSTRWEFESNFDGFEWPPCPRCGTHLFEGSTKELVFEWIDTRVEPTAVCPSCGCTDLLGNFEHVWSGYCTYASLPFVNSWSLNKTFEREPLQRIGGRSRVLYGSCDPRTCRRWLASSPVCTDHCGARRRSRPSDHICETSCR